VAALLTLAPVACQTGEGTDHDHELDGSLGGGSGTDGDLDPNDRDGDGFTVDEGDCDDQNRLAHPDATERSGDGTDSNCDGDELPVLELVWAAGGDDNVVDALELLDDDEDGAVSLAEFAAGCAESSRLSGAGRPGLVQVHASCAGTNSCRGMVYQSWNEVYEHSCRGVNSCSGWSCVELAEDIGRTGEVAFTAAHCDFCHSPYDEDHNPIAGVFQVQVPPGSDSADYLADFWSSRSQDHLRSVIAFGVAGVTEEGVAFSNMPAASAILSLTEVDRLIEYIQDLELEAHVFDPLIAPDPIE
jgi:hypothetical protein